MNAILVIVISAIGAVLSLYLSKPEKPRRAFCAALIIVITFLWQGVSAYKEKQRDKIRDAYALEELARSTYIFVEALRDAIFYTSDGWLPSDEDEFFSERAAILFSQHLNLESEAPVRPKRTWRVYLVQHGLAYRAALQTAIERNAFESEILAAIVEARRTTWLNVYLQNMEIMPQILGEIGVKRPPLWLERGSGDQQLHKDLLAFKRLLVRLRMEGSPPQEPWKMLSMASDNRWPKHVLGTSRFP